VLAISTLGLPHRINSNVRVSFRGAGRARFRLQHTGTRDGKPDPLGWCEVSAVSNGALACPADAIDIRTLEVPGGVLVDVVDGDVDVLYRRHSADWLRVIPLDDATGELDADNLDACLGYAISIEPVA
jgi:hypothetical protein